MIYVLSALFFASGGERGGIDAATGGTLTLLGQIGPPRKGRRKGANRTQGGGGGGRDARRFRGGGFGGALPEEYGATEQSGEEGEGHKRWHEPPRTGSTKARGRKWIKHPRMVPWGGIGSKFAVRRQTRKGEMCHYQRRERREKGAERVPALSFGRKRSMSGWR